MVSHCILDLLPRFCHAAFACLDAHDARLALLEGLCKLHSRNADTIACLYSVNLPQSSDDGISFPGSELPHIRPLHGCMLLHGHWHEIRHSRDYSWLSCWHAHLLQRDPSCRADLRNASPRISCETGDDVLTDMHRALCRAAAQEPIDGQEPWWLTSGFAHTLLPGCSSGRPGSQEPIMTMTMPGSQTCSMWLCLCARWGELPKGPRWGPCP